MRLPFNQFYILHHCTCLQAQLAESEAQLAEAHKAAATAAAEAQAARAALAANQQEQRGDVAALRQQLEAEVERVGAACRRHRWMPCTHVSLSRPA